MKQITKKSVVNLILMLMIVVLGIALIPNNNMAFAEAFAITLDGKYEVEIADTNIPTSMVGDNMKNPVIEKECENYYLSIYVKPSAISKLQIKLGNDKVGLILKDEGDYLRYIYSVSKQTLQSKIGFIMHVEAMGSDVDSYIKLNLSSKKKLSDKIDDLGERPAIFVPTIITDAGDSEVQKGSSYKIMSASAKFNGEDIKVTTSCYYVSEGKNESVPIENGQIKIDKIGEYHVIYKAETNSYLTNMGNKSYSVVDITIMSKLTVNTVAKVENLPDKHTLPTGLSTQATRVNKNSELYKQVEEQVKKYSDNFEIINVALFNKNGTNVKLTENVNLYLNIDNTFDRSKAEVYHIQNDGSLKKIECESYGRYVKLQTNEMGNFVVLVKGVKFVMPMWAYAVILVASLIVLALIITLIVLVVKKKKMLALTDEEILARKNNKKIKVKKEKKTKEKLEVKPKKRRKNNN